MSYVGKSTDEFSDLHEWTFIIKKNVKNFFTAIFRDVDYNFHPAKETKVEGD